MHRLLLLCFTILLISCKDDEDENWDDLQKVKVGMTYDEANAVMRNGPKEIQTAFWNDSLIVQYYQSPGTASDDYRIVFSKRDSTVVEIGYGD